MSSFVKILTSCKNSNSWYLTYFRFLSGVELPGSILIIDASHKETTLVIPDQEDNFPVWYGTPQPLEQIAKEHLLTRVYAFLLPIVIVLFCWFHCFFLLVHKFFRLYQAKLLEFLKQFEHRNFFTIKHNEIKEFEFQNEKENTEKLTA